MESSIPTGNSESQSEKFPVEIALAGGEFLEWNMPKSDEPADEELKLGPWLALGKLTQVQAAKIGGCEQSYIANMVAGRKENPSALILLRIARKIGVTVNDLYERPPTANEAAAFGRLSPKAQETVLRVRRQRG